MPDQLTENGITAVITTHRRPKQLASAIRSASAQGPMIREILVCEDGADSSTRAVVENLQRGDARIRHINVCSRAKGPAEGRNMGIENATSPWIAFLDDDDIWLSSKTVAQAQLMREADVICSNALLTSGGAYFNSMYKPRFRPDHIVRSNSVILSTSMVRRSVLSASRPFCEDPSMRGVEDCVLWSSLSREGARFAYMPDPLVIYDDSGPERLSAEKASVALALSRFSAAGVLRKENTLGWVSTLTYHTAGTLWFGASRATSEIRRRCSGGPRR